MYMASGADWMEQITEEDMRKLSDINKIGHALKVGIMDLKAGLERRCDEYAEVCVSL